jgi:signal transduction histidine kinase
VSFRTRLVLAAAYLVAAVVLALEIPLALSIERRADSDFQADVLGRTALLAARISDDVVVASQGGASVDKAALAQGVSSSTATPDERIVVTNARGHVLVDSTGEAVTGSKFGTAERPEFGVALEGGRVDSRRRFSDTAGEELLLVTVPVVDGGEVVGAVRVSASRDSVVDRVHNSWLRLAAIGLAVVAGAFVLAWILATTVSRPLGRLRDTAGELGGGDLDARAPTDGPAELAALGVSFNRMADALGTSMRVQRDFVANASHQLRTPLTGIKLRLEAIRAEGGVAGENAEKAEEELDRLEALVDDLLALAGAATPSSSGSTVDLSSVAENAVERWQAPAGEAGKTVGAGRLEDALVFADPADLAHVVDNLIENALRYTPPGAQVTVEAASENGRGALVVADDGPGIPEEDRARVFERFYRGANGRRLGPGTGLGLAIVAELVERWHGEVTLSEGPGTRVRVVFRQTPADR